MAQWDPGQLKVTYGVIVITGFAEGSMVSIARNGDGDTSVTGTAGETARVRSRDQSARVTIRLMKTSPAAKALNLLINSGNPPQPLVITDLDEIPPTTHVCPDAFLAREPDIDYAAELPVREYVVVCPKLATVG